jgi:hypothetical protein
MDALQGLAKSLLDEFSDLRIYRVEFIEWFSGEKRGWIVSVPTDGAIFDSYAGRGDKIEQATDAFRAEMETIRRFRADALKDEVERFRAWKREHGYPDE